MKKLLLIMGLLSLILITGCTEKPVACTEEAKICPDGSAVGRVGPNCEFAACPNSTGIANPASTFCEKNGGKVEIITDSDGSQKGDCILADGTRCDEWDYFRGECSSNSTCLCPTGYVKGEGDICNPKCYYSTPKCLMPSINCTELALIQCPAECPQLSPPGPEFCPNGTIVPGEKDWCGCTSAPTCDTGKATRCTDPRPEVCTMDYNPACGYFNESIKCIKYPCAATYGNACGACSDPKVAYYEMGECLQ